MPQDTKETQIATTKTDPNKIVTDSSPKNLPKEILFNEISITGSSIYKASGIIDYNPDDLVGKKGLEIYQKMLIDDQIKAVLTMKKFARLMSSWTIEAASTDERDKEIANLVRYNIDTLVGTFEETLLNILTALEFGYSISEEIWYQIERGEWAGKIGLRALKTRQPFLYGFNTDDKGNLREYGIIYQGGQGYNVNTAPLTSSWLPGISQSNPNFVGSPFPTNKFVIYSYCKEFDNWYGKSDLRSAYRSYWSKEVLIRFMNIYMERFGMPTHVGKYKRGLSPTDKTTLKDILDKVQAKYSIVIPDDISLELLQAAGGGEGGYRNAIEMHNRFIARSILVPDLLGFTEASGGGSYALGKKHFDVFLWMIKKLGKDIEENIVNDQIIKRLVDFNYSNVYKYPKFKFEDITEEGTQTKAMIVAAGIQGGYINPKEAWIRNYLSLPEVAEGIELGIPQPNLLPPQLPASSETPEEEAQPSSNLKQYVDSLKNTLFTKKNVGKVLIPSIDIKKNEEKLKEVVEVEPTKFDKKVEYKKIRKDLEEYENQTIQALSNIIKKQRDALIRDIERKRIFEDNKTSEIKKLQLKYVGDYKKELENRMFKIHLDSKVETLKELIRADVPVELKVLFQGGFIQEWDSVPPTEAIDYFNRKVIAKVVTESGKKVVLDLATKEVLPYYSSKAFTVAGIERDYILSQVKQIILGGLKSGDSKQSMFDIEELFKKYLETGEIVDNSLVKPHRLELIVRQNTMESLNSGRRAMMEDPDISGFLPYWQYSAILDSRVRPSHAEMHGRIYPSNSPIWDTIYPPNGFACRCSVSSITRPEVNMIIKSGGGIEISTAPLPPDFPDIGFTKYSEDTYLEYKKKAKYDVVDNGNDTDLTKDYKEIIDGYEWVVRCPYPSCGSSNIKCARRLQGAVVYFCESCEHEFKVLKEKDIYLYDVGKEEWVNASSEMRPSYFSEKRQL